MKRRDSFKGRNSDIWEVRCKKLRITKFCSDERSDFKGAYFLFASIYVVFYSQTRQVFETMQQGEAGERRQIAASSSYRNEVIPVRTERKQCAAELIPWGRNPFFATVVVCARNATKFAYILVRCGLFTSMNLREVHSPSEWAIAQLKPERLTSVHRKSDLHLRSLQHFFE